MKMGKIKDDTVIETIEGIGSVDNLHPLQVAWMGHGWCTVWFLFSWFYHVSKSASGGESFSYQGGKCVTGSRLHRNLCRCTGYKPLIDAVMDAAKVMRGEMKKEDLIFKPVGNKILGTSYIRPSAIQKVTGTWDYGADMALQMPENTARLALVQADIPHCQLKRHRLF